MKKYLTYLFIIFVGIFGFIQKTYAVNAYCNYKLPFLGIDENGNLIRYGSVNNNLFTVTYDKHKSGKNWNFSSWYSSGTFSAKNYKSCPDYVKIHFNYGLVNGISASSDNLNGVYNGYGFTKKGLSYYDFFQRLDENPGYNQTITLPLYSGGASESSIKNSKSTINATANKAINIWNSTLNSKINSMKNACGSKWKNMLNKGNYTNFNSYINGGYPSSDGLQGPDKNNNISSSCWVARQNLVKYSNAYMDFAKSIQVDNLYKDAAVKNDKFIKMYEIMSLPINGKKNTESELSNMEGSKNAEKVEKELKTNMCLPLCQTDVSDKSKDVEACKKKKQYKNCLKKYTECKSKNNTNDSAVKECLKTNLSKATWEKLEENTKKLKSSIGKNSLGVTSIPKFDVNVGQSYKLKCSDVGFLHPLWIFLTIATPILVIAFGSLDMMKSVIAGDPQKIVQNRKKFTTRLLAGVLVFVAFTFVSIVVGMSNNDSVNDTNIIKCIVNGE